MSDADLLMARVRRARGKFAAMAATYCLGVFNDNFFKQAACLIAIYIGRPELQGVAVVIFTLPWLLFAAPAGWMADRFPKRHVVIGAKMLELAAMICGGIGVITLNWTLVMIMMFLMALQSTIFSPALNGSIPELFPPSYVIRANSKLKMVIMLGNLVGIILAGVILNLKTPVPQLPIDGLTLGRLTVGLGVIGISVIGVVVSFGVAGRPAADPSVRFPWSGPVNTVRELWAMRRDRLLATVVAADAFVWFVAVLQILIINQLGKARFGLDEQQTSFLLVPELVGVAIGGLLAGWLATGERWYRVLAPAMGLLAAMTGLLAITPHLPTDAQLPWVVGGLFLAGLAGGVLLIPLESFFQIRPAPEKKGAVIAAANFAGFLGMMVSGVVDLLMQAIHLAPAYRFGVVGALALLVAVWLRKTLRKEAAGD